MNEKQLVVKTDNALANAAYSLSLGEKRLILLAIARANGDRDALKNITVHADEYAKAFNVTRQGAYMALSESALQLFDRRFSYQLLTPTGCLMTSQRRWVRGIDYIETEARVNILFSDDVLPLLCDLQNRFAYYVLEQVAYLTSVHAIRLYELLISWRSTGKTPLFKLADFRQKLGIEESEYPRMTDFKRWVLDAAIAQINKHTDIFVAYEQHKRGRSITGFTFTFKQKKLPCDPKIIDLINGTADAEKRQNITKAQAELMARTGETWPDLINRLSRDYCITGLKA